MNQEQIEAFLPHRKPMRLVDELEAVSDTEVTGRCRITGDEFFLQGHFPGMPVVPGVILCEMIAQTASLLVKEELEKGRKPLFTGMEGVRFRNMVVPGDLIETHVKLLRVSGKSLIKVEGSASVDGKICAQGTFLMMLTQEAAK